MEASRPPLDEVAECVERTLAAASARLQFRFEIDFSAPKRKRRRRGGLLRPLLGLVKRAGWGVFRRAMRRWSPFGLDGFIEPSRRRYMAGSGASGQVWKDGALWSGRSGQALAEVKPSRKPPSLYCPWWYLDALRGVSEATVEGDDPVRGAPCRRLAARVDLARASAAAPAGLHAPAVDRFEDLLALPLDVWIDGTYVRRVAYDQGTATSTIELWDFGVSTDGLDWSRMPAEDTDDEAGDSGARSHARELLRRVRSARTS